MKQKSYNFYKSIFMSFISSLATDKCTKKYVSKYLCYTNRMSTSILFMENLQTKNFSLFKFIAPQFILSLLFCLAAATNDWSYLFIFKYRRTDIL